MDIPWRQTS